MRKRLINSIRSKGIKDEAVLSAMQRVPRHFFMEKAFMEKAYEDQAFPIGNDQTISQPYTVAFMTSLLQVEKRDKVLEIGTGSGYQAAILAELGARVYTIERQKALYDETRARLKNIGYDRIRVFYRDGMKGLPEFEPFDGILVTAGARSIPDALRDQLAIHGRLVIPVGNEKLQQMLRITRISEKEFKEERFDHFRFVPLLGGLEND